MPATASPCRFCPWWRGPYSKAWPPVRRLAIKPAGSLVLAWLSFLHFWPWKCAPPSSSPLPSLSETSSAKPKKLDQRSVHRKMLVRQQRLDLRMVQKPGHELREARRPFCSRSPVPGHGGLSQTGSSRTSDTKDCSPVAPSTGVPSGCRQRLQRQGAWQLLPGGSKDVPRWHKPPKAAVQITQKHPDKFPDLPQRMVR